MVLTQRCLQADRCGTRRDRGENLLICCSSVAHRIAATWVQLTTSAAAWRRLWTSRRGHLVDRPGARTERGHPTGHPVQGHPTPHRLSSRYPGSIAALAPPPAFCWSSTTPSSATGCGCFWRAGRISRSSVRRTTAARPPPACATSTSASCSWTLGSGAQRVAGDKGTELPPTAGVGSPGGEPGRRSRGITGRRAACAAYRTRASDGAPGYRIP